jgi:hypothetical protein
MRGEKTYNLILLNVTMTIQYVSKVSKGINWTLSFLSTFLTPLKMSLEMAHQVIVPQKKNYVPKFLKQRDIGNFMSFRNHGPSIMSRSFLNSVTLIVTI